MSDFGKAVFLSYASQDAEAAKRICEALRTAGVEVWFDQSELVGGDQWDGKIRGQISSCALFMPIISANTQARLEGYFRREWKQAAARTHDMADEKTFLLPVVIDGTRDAEAKVPAEFKSVQWTKLMDGETPPAFCERVKRLLGGEAVGGALRPDSSEPSGRKAPPTKESKRWLAPVIAGGVIAVLALLLARPWEKAPPLEPSARRSAPITTETTAPHSEARQLVARAWEQMNKPELARPELEIADELCKSAVALEPNDAAVWAAWSQVDAWYLYHNFDSSPSRREGARTKAARAIQLAPASYEARLAQACQLIRCEGNDNPTLFAAEADRTLRTLLQEQPGEPRALLALGILLRNTDRMDEVRVVFGQLANNPAFATQAWNELGWAEYLHGNFRAAGPPTEASISLQPYWGNLMLQTLLAMRWTGDLDLAKDTMERIPAAIRQEDNGISQSSEVYYWRREPDNELRVLNSVARDWLRSNASDGPKATLAGEALLLAGRREAAEVQLRAALKLVEQHLAEQPGDGNLLRQKGQLLALLGDRTGAEKALRLARDMGNRNSTLGEATDQVLLGNLDAALALLEKAVAERSRFATAAMYRLNPRWDPLREQPRFKALLARMEADPRFSPKAVPAPSSFLPARPELAERAPSHPPEADAKSVAVLAFANLSDDKGNEYFSDGISEELLNVLAKIPGLKVTARTSSFHFKGKDTPIPEIAAQLGVAYVIEGSVRKQGDKVRITAQLIKAADGFHVWSETFTRDLKDIFAVQDEIAGLIAQQLQLKLGESSRVTKVVNPEAYRLLLEGRQFWNLRSEEGFTKAEAAFTKALALDPQFAEAHAGLGGVCVIRAVYHELDDVPLEANDLARAVSEGRRALEIDPASADALAVLAYAQMMGNQLAESDRHFQQALEHNSNSALVHCWYALLLNAQGRLDASIRHYQKAAEVDPLWFINLHMMGSALSFAQRYDQALGVLERADALRTEVFMPDLWERARALLALGRKEEAFAVARQVLRNPDQHPRWGSDAMAIHVLWSGGRRQEAEEEAGRLFTRYPQESYLRGFIFAAMGRFNEALPFLQHTPSVMVRHIYWDTMWDPWREDPRFLQLMAGFGRTEEYKVARATLARMQEERKK